MTDSLRAGGLEVLDGADDARRACQSQLERPGHPLPLAYSLEWQQGVSGLPSFFVAVRDADGHCRSGCAATVQRSRVAPGFASLRVEKLGSSVQKEDVEPLADALRQLASRRRILRLNVEVFSRDAELRSLLGGALTARGFDVEPTPRGYTQTAVIELDRSESDLLSGFSKTARANLKAAAKAPVESRPITTPDLAARLKALQDEAFARTGSAAPTVSWERVIAFSDRHPSLSRVVGVFRADEPSAAGLLGFAWGVRCGDAGIYEAAATTRPSDLKVPLSYPLVWDLILWARGHGASWFDLGGITLEENSGHAALSGISGFKRYFSTRIETVQQEWTLSHRRRLSAIVRHASVTMDAVRRWKARS